MSCVSPLNRPFLKTVYPNCGGAYRHIGGLHAKFCHRYIAQPALKRNISTGFESRERCGWRQMTREPRQPLEFRLRPARPRDYFFAVALYLDGAKRHLSKIGRWDQRRLTVKFRHGYKQVQTQVICVGGKPIGWMQVAEFVGRLHLR